MEMVLERGTRKELPEAFTSKRGGGVEGVLPMVGCWIIR
jgi:hypothetical protein